METPLGGQMMDTPEGYKMRRALAQEMMKTGLDSSPVRSPWQGAARMANALIGGLAYNQAAQGELQGMNAQGEMWAKAAESLNPSLSQPISNPMGSAPQALGRALMPNTAPGKIYSNDEPSPLDPPSGKDRDMAIRTVYGEDPGKSALAVANVIRNRAVSGQYGGDTPTGVVTAPNQFEPWSNPQAKARMMALQPGSPEYERLGGVVDSAYTGANDPTKGATQFYAPQAQAALGRPAPSWAQGPAQDIGPHRFYGGAQQPIQVAANGPIIPDTNGAPPPAPQQPQMQPQQVAQQPAQTPPADPQNQQMVQRLIQISRDPNSNPYQRQAANQMLQGLVTKQMGAEMKYIPQPDGSVAWFNPFNPQQHGTITDPDMIRRLGEKAGVEAGAQQSAKTESDIRYAPQTTAIKGQESYQAEKGKLTAARDVAAPSTDSLGQKDLPGRINDTLTKLQKAGYGATGIVGAKSAKLAGTEAANLQEELDSLSSALTEQHVNEFKRQFPESRGMSGEQIDQYRKSLGLNVSNPQGAIETLKRLHGEMSGTARPGAVIDQTPKSGSAVARQPLVKGGYEIMGVRKAQ